MIQLYAGDGKGKTTASIGLAVRAAGHGFKVLFMQFLKYDLHGEIEILRNLPGVEIVQPAVNYGFTWQMTQDQKEETAQEYDRMLEQAICSDAFLIVLDEVVHALNFGLVDVNRLKGVLLKGMYMNKCEIVLTGRNPPDWLIERVDYYSEICKVKHPYDYGKAARIGVEY